MKKMLLVSLMLLCSAGLWAKKYPASLKMVDGMEKTGEVDFPDWGDKELKFYPEGGKAVKVASADVAVMKVTVGRGDVVEYEYIPTILAQNVVRKNGKLTGKGWFAVQLRGYMTLYHHGQESTVTATSSAKGNTLNPGQVVKYCRRSGEEGASVISSVLQTTVKAGTNAMFKALALAYFADDEQIIEKVKSEKYTYKDIEAIVVEYNTRHGR